MSLGPARALARIDWAGWPTRHVFFTGKGGVGKTTTAAAVAVALAQAAKPTLLISTDPASNLDDVLGLHAAGEPTPVPGISGLWIANIDPDRAAADYRERALEPYRGVLPDTALANMAEELSGACTTEIAAFNEFTAILTDDSADAYAHVLFDTAPTGHTLRLLTLPGAWSGYAEQHPSGASCLGPLAGLERQRRQYHDAVATLADPARTQLVLVARPDRGTLREAARASRELRGLGISNQRLVINGVLAERVSDPIAAAVADEQDAALASASNGLAALPVAAIDLQAGDLTGLDALTTLVAGGVRPVPDDAIDQRVEVTELPQLAELVDELDAAGRGVVMAMGKGGVGKTTVAAALAVALADRGHDVTLSTTDPAAHLTDTLAGDTHDRLCIERIDPAAETARYSSEILTAADDLDAEGRALLAEDLRSPCTEEIAVFRAFARTLADGTDRIVVLDTAPTGHTLLLLDAAASYQREIERTHATVPDHVRQLAERLRDPAFARILIVTNPDATPIHEAGRLQQDLRRADIEPYGWIINGSMHELRTDSPTLHARARAQRPHLHRIQQLATRTWAIPWHPRPITGTFALRQLTAAFDAAR